MPADIAVGGHLYPYAYEDIVIDGTVKSLTASIFRKTSSQSDRDGGNARLAVVTFDGGATFRYTLDGTSPVAATTGHLGYEGTILELTSVKQMTGLKMTRETATSMNARVSYYR